MYASLTLCLNNCSLRTVFISKKTLCSYPKSFEWFVKLHSDYKVTAKQDRYTDKQQMVINVPLLDPCEN